MVSACNYAKVGGGSQVAIIPGRLFTFTDFQRLAQGRTLIFYDMRNRRLSDAVIDISKISLQHDADDLEAIRAHFGIERPDLIGFSYLGKIVVLYAMQHPNHVNRIVQIGPVARKFGAQFPEPLTAGDENKVPDPAEIKRMEALDKGQDRIRQNRLELLVSRWAAKSARWDGLLTFDPKGEIIVVSSAEQRCPQS